MTNGGEWGSFVAVSIVLAELTGLWEDAVRKPGRNPKRRWELAEAAFLLKAQSMGFRVATLRETATATILFWIPDGGCAECSLSRPRFCIRGDTKYMQSIYGAYGRGKSGYTADDIDVLVVRIRPVDAWYVLPIAAVALAKNLRFYPDIERECARWEGYREAWRVMGSDGVGSSKCSDPSLGALRERRAPLPQDDGLVLG